MSIRTLFTTLSHRVPVPSTSTCTCIHFQQKLNYSQTSVASLTSNPIARSRRPAKVSQDASRTPAGESRSRPRARRGHETEKEEIPTNATLETLSPDLRDKLDVRLIAHLARPPTDGECRAYLPTFLARERKQRGQNTSATSAIPSTAPNTPKHPDWLVQRQVLRAAFPTGWNPPKKLSREAISLLRLLHQSNPSAYQTPVLAERFKISPEAVRRILKSKWEISGEEGERRERKRKEKRELERLENDEKAWAGDIGSERREMARLRVGKEGGSE